MKFTSWMAAAGNELPGVQSMNCMPPPMLTLRSTEGRPLPDSCMTKTSGRPSLLRSDTVALRDTPSLTDSGRMSSVENVALLAAS